MYFSDADIKPSRYIPAWWAVYPPRREDFEWVFDLGYLDTVAWLKRNHAHKSRNRETIKLINPCSLSKCREQFENRQVSLLDRHELSFKRFFGYRTVWRLLPSK